MVFFSFFSLFPTTLPVPYTLRVPIIKIIIGNYQLTHDGGPSLYRSSPTSKHSSPTRSIIRAVCLLDVMTRTSDGLSHPIQPPISQSSSCCHFWYHRFMYPLVISTFQHFPNLAIPSHNCPLPLSHLNPC